MNAWKHRPWARAVRDAADQAQTAPLEQHIPLALFAIAFAIVDHANAVRETARPRKDDQWPPSAN